MGEPAPSYPGAPHASQSWCDTSPSGQCVGGACPGLLHRRLAVLNAVLLQSGIPWARQAAEGAAVALHPQR